MKDTQGIRYVEIQKEQPNNLEEQSDKDLRNFQRELYDCCREFLKEDAKHCVFDVSADEKYMILVLYILKTLRSVWEWMINIPFCIPAISCQ